MVRDLTGVESGSHMPLDSDLHWEWRNPLNIFPIIVLAAVVLAMIGMLA
jgi:hypothetical protein